MHQAAQCCAAQLRVPGAGAGQVVFAEGDFYDGDLLKSVLTSDISYWKMDRNSWNIINNLFKENLKEIETFDTTEEIRSGLMTAFSKFEKIQQ